jgi:hypothetical protein
METRTITADEALDLVARGESHFWDFKSSKSSGKVVQKTDVRSLTPTEESFSLVSRTPRRAPDSTAGRGSRLSRMATTSCSR